MVQWAPITGLSDSCSPALQLHLHWERRTSDGRPVEDIVSSHRVISPDSPQETMVCCTQFKGLTVHGGILLYGGRGLYFLTAVDNFCERSWGNFGTQDFNHFTCLQMFCLLTGRIASLPVLEDSLIEQRCFLASLFSSSLMSICLEKAESGVIGWQQRFITVCYFPRVPIKILIVPLRRASPLQSICEQCIK